MEESTANIQVVEMEQRNFRNYWSYFHNMYAERKRDLNGSMLSLVGQSGLILVLVKK